MADDYKTPAYYQEHKNDPSIPDLRNSINSQVTNPIRKEWHPAFTEKYERPIRYMRKNPAGEDYGQQIAELRKSVDSYFIFTYTDEAADELFEKRDAQVHTTLLQPQSTTSGIKPEVLAPKKDKQPSLFDADFAVNNKVDEKDKRKGGLGHSLSSIIDEEKSAIKPVRYFEDDK
ncbi:hypothetical protein EQG49_02830 [Periweissella cryptocerci]|uniref:Uncharacterized protein n=1 Tax=Periweissella cryptocerci TaxID=2506420 RepID=A0A4P6YS76_9LACO|nr:hypothetical protein [Periweissella cryptocerci]QBO35463.1 hypothetical protein EQG49_02830 [Periweissella cryptocerci]